MYCCAFNHSFAQNIIFLTNIIFIQGAFKNIQGLLWKIHGIFKDIAQFFIFQGLFKDMMLFQGLFQGLCEPCYRVRNRAVTKGQALGISPGYYEHDHCLFSCFLMSSKQFYTFKDFSMRQNTDRLKQKIHCLLGMQESRFKFDWLRQLMNDGFIIQINNSSMESWGVRLTWLNCKNGSMEQIITQHCPVHKRLHRNCP